jgi:FPC/CPF motif-containing protein YcgG
MNWQDEQKKVATGVTGGQEPVAWGMENYDGQIYDCITPEEHAREEGEYTVALYREPQHLQTWVGLTHEEIDYQAKKDDHAVYFALGALWAEAKLKEKNEAH